MDVLEGDVDLALPSILGRAARCIGAKGLAARRVARQDHKRDARVDLVLRKRPL